MPKEKGARVAEVSERTCDLLTGRDWAQEQFIHLLWKRGRERTWIKTLAGEWMWLVVHFYRSSCQIT